MNPLELVESVLERFHQQWSTGEWEGPGQQNWLTGRMPCGLPTATGPRRWPCHDGSRGRRGLPPWSIVMASEPRPRGWGG